MKYTRFFPLILFSSLVLAQGGPPPPGPLGPPPVPAGNPITTAKANLGKTLFWEEQLSSTRTVACGTCHQPASGGSDARSGSINSLNPGPDGVFQTPDDIIGSPGVPLHEASGTYTWSDAFGIYEQVTGRKSPSAVNSAYAPRLFWDGRATGTFRDPLTNAVVINNGAALESQVLGPPVSSAEMAHQSRNWQQVADQIASATPLVLAESIPNDLANWLADRGYPALFEEAFGSTEVTPTRIAMAIATYERTLVSDQTPLDADASGVPNALTQQERRGRNVFVQNDCAQCHAGPLLTDNNFHYIGVRPVNDDLGRFNETGNNQDRGAFKTPGLRNVAQRSHFFHNGRFQTLQEVIDFYDRGGDFNAPNKDPRIRPRNMTANQKADLLAFLTRPLTDLRVANEQAPFDRPTLFSESNRVPQISGSGKAARAGLVPCRLPLNRRCWVTLNSRLPWMRLWAGLRLF
ncbi:MAG: hypothetical protein H6510_09250 [Acidobacteria bacterium]|nr:hypothetical protein [Acidobacteriota bacterium]